MNLTVKIEQLGFQISPAWCERRLKFCFPDLSTSRFLSRTTWWPCEGRILTVSTTCYSLRKIIAIMKQQNYSFLPQIINFNEILIFGKANLSPPKTKNIYKKILLLTNVEIFVKNLLTLSGFFIIKNNFREDRRIGST